MPRAKSEWLMPHYGNLGPERIWSIVAYLEHDILPPGRVAQASP
jgi:hypothetical protein